MNPPFTRMDKWLILLILVNVFPWWQAMLAIVAAAIAGTLEDWLLEKWSGRRQV